MHPGISKQDFGSKQRCRYHVICLCTRWGISEHESTGDAFVTCLGGKDKIMIDGKPYFLEKCESIVMPANHPHAVYGEENFKMMLVVVFPLM